ncbi:adenosylcobinamide-phosphate synthase CbiB [uncultured Tolumonas sp.]|uniref:adenosylcobinamide-phosphate synthase CbiB n=1 Tax=uncultured Tolumonas sp. TaxID=263765 RepID=UPI002A0A3A0B|nr:adenosylcobinamide-phosphate synthase CbiB [uncultured Tolumonas sp.]
MTLVLYSTAFLLDLILGDPHHWPHPIRWIGNSISWVQKQLRAICHSEPALYIGGAVLWVVIVGSTWLITWVVISGLSAVNIWLGRLVELWLAYTILAGRCLSDAAMDVYRALNSGSLENSRRQLSYIVGRDTSQLHETQITRGVVETVAENTVDGVIAPLFYLFLGGVPLAMAYKAINTLDSMVGYKNEKYKAIGCVSARIDDLANLIPARISWLLLAMAAWCLKLDARQAFKIGWRDRYQHKSPNCGWPEATVAGALGVRLGGPNSYFGELVEKPWIGDPLREINQQDIKLTIRLMFIASAMALVLFSIMYWIFH